MNKEEEEKLNEQIKKYKQEQEESVDKYTYLLSFLEVDGERYISIRANNILEALIKFAQKYQDVCVDWQAISLNIEMIEELE